MTNDEANRVAQAMQPLDQFASTTPLGRGWHGTWQSLFAQTIREVAAMIDKPAVKEVSKKPLKAHASKSSD